MLEGWITEALLPAILLVGFVTLIVAAFAWRSSRRSENLGRDRYELLRDQHDRLELLREERRVLVEELKRESRERQQLMESLREASSQLAYGLEQARQERIEAQQERIESERRDERREQVRAGLEQELRRLGDGLESLKPSAELERVERPEDTRPWWRRRIFIFALWLTVIVVALRSPKTSSPFRRR